MVRVSQPVLSMLPSGARAIGPSAGLLEGPDGGVVFVFGRAALDGGAARGDEDLLSAGGRRGVRCLHGDVVAVEPDLRPRRCARAGPGPDRAEAPVVLTEGAHLPLAGLLLALPALEMTGLLDVATATFGPMSKGFYGL